MPLSRSIFTVNLLLLFAMALGCRCYLGFVGSRSGCWSCYSSCLGQKRTYHVRELVGSLLHNKVGQKLQHIQAMVFVTSQRQVSRLLALQQAVCNIQALVTCGCMTGMWACHAGHVTDTATQHISDDAGISIIHKMDVNQVWLAQYFTRSVALPVASPVPPGMPTCTRRVAHSSLPAVLAEVRAPAF